MTSLRLIAAATTFSSRRAAAATMEKPPRFGSDADRESRRGAGTAVLFRLADSGNGGWGSEAAPFFQRESNAMMSSDEAFNERPTPRAHGQAFVPCLGPGARRALRACGRPCRHDARRVAGAWNSGDEPRIADAGSTRSAAMDGHCRLRLRRRFEYAALSRRHG